MLGLVTGYPYVSFFLLLILILAGYEDIRRRKITTITFLVMDIALLFYYLFVDYWLAFLILPVISEFFLKKISLVAYAIILIPLVFDLSVVTLSISYALLLAKLFGVLVKNFGRGDVKVLQTIAVAIPLYPHLPVTDSLFPPVLSIALIASAAGTVASLVVNALVKKAQIVQPLPTMANFRNETKFWTDGSRMTYKIPFVTFIAAGYAVILILSLLRLV